MDIGKFVKSTGGYTVGVILSLGPSQVYGLVKGAIDSVRLAVIQAKIFYYGAQESSLRNAAKMQTEQEAKSMEVGLENVAHIKHDQYEKLKSAKLRALKADAYALIPFVGAIASWRVYNEQGIESATEQIAEDYQKFVSKVFYPGDLQKSTAQPAGRLKISVFDPNASNHTRFLNAYYQRHSDDTTRPTVVIFHGNGCTAEAMNDYGNYYDGLGYDVLMPTMGGYRGSEGISTTEESTYRDVEAIKLFLQDKGVTEVGYYGMSIGASLAMQAATSETSTTNLNTKFVVADQAFSTAMTTCSIKGVQWPPSTLPE